jgi:hypothetical protein
VLPTSLAATVPTLHQIPLTCPGISRPPVCHNRKGKHRPLLQYTILSFGEDSGSPFAVILIGQPTLRQRLRLGVLAAPDQRIAVRYQIAGMSTADTADYIRHHYKIAGRSDTLFSDDAIALIHNASRGHSRAVTTSPCTRSPPPSPPTTPSSTKKQHATPSPKSPRTEPDPRRLDHHPVKPTGPRHHAHHGPAHHTGRGRSHALILVNPDDTIIVIVGDAQHSPCSTRHRYPPATSRYSAGQSVSALLP